jgi:large subunit ribosomal protein L29
MKSQDMHNMTAVELAAHHEELVDELSNLRVKLVLRQLENPLSVRLLRREIARARTILVEKQQAETKTANDKVK